MKTRDDVLLEQAYLQVLENILNTQSNARPQQSHQTNVARNLNTQKGQLGPLFKQALSQSDQSAAQPQQAAAAKPQSNTAPAQPQQAQTPKAPDDDFRKLATSADLLWGSIADLKKAFGNPYEYKEGQDSYGPYARKMGYGQEGKQTTRGNSIRWFVNVGQVQADGTRNITPDQVGQPLMVDIGIEDQQPANKPVSDEQAEREFQVTAKRYQSEQAKEALHKLLAQKIPGKNFSGSW